MLRVLLVEDSLILAERVREVLSLIPEVEIVDTVPEYRRYAERLGVEYFLNKSCDYERLPEVIRELQRPTARRR